MKKNIYQTTYLSIFVGLILWAPLKSIAAENINFPSINKILADIAREGLAENKAERARRGAPTYLKSATFQVNEKNTDLLNPDRFRLELSAGVVASKSSWRQDKESTLTLTADLSANRIRGEARVGFKASLETDTIALGRYVGTLGVASSCQKLDEQSKKSCALARRLERVSTIRELVAIMGEVNTLELEILESEIAALKKQPRTPNVERLIASKNSRIPWHTLFGNEVKKALERGSNTDTFLRYRSTDIKISANNSIENIEIYLDGSKVELALNYTTHEANHVASAFSMRTDLIAKILEIQSAQKPEETTTYQGAKFVFALVVNLAEGLISGEK